MYSSKDVRICEIDEYVQNPPLQNPAWPPSVDASGLSACSNQQAFAVIICPRRLHVNSTSWVHTRRPCRQDARRRAASVTRSPSCPVSAVKRIQHGRRKPEIDASYPSVGGRQGDRAHARPFQTCEDREVGVDARQQVLARDLAAFNVEVTRLGLEPVTDKPPTTPQGVGGW